MPINYKDYPPDWPQRRARILARAQNCCEHCDVPNYSIIIRTGQHYVVLRQCKNIRWARLWKQALSPAIMVVLTVAHLNHDEWNHEVKDADLAALCQRCHFRYDRHDNQQRKKYGKQFKKNQLSIL